MIILTFGNKLFTVHKLKDNVFEMSRITSPSMLCHHTRPGISYISMCLPGLTPQAGTGSTDLKHPCRPPSALLFPPPTHTPINKYTDLVLWVPSI